MKPTFFKSAAAFRQWLDKNHHRVPELYLGFHKVGSGKPGITYKQALDEALCMGWIDGVRKGFDESGYTVRFTPRKAKSYWSDVNTKRMKELIAAGLVKPPGLAAFARRDAAGAKYSFEAQHQPLAVAAKKALAANTRAQRWFSAQAPSYQRVTSFWVMSAKKEETRQKRLATLIECSAQGKVIPPLRWAKL